eukprot:gene30590-6032_t
MTQLTAAAKRKREALAEAEMLRQIQHHNIINYIDAFSNDDTMSIEMEYADGGSIHDKVGKQMGKFFEETRIWWYTWQMLCGLQYIHAVNIIHRDIKPENIFLTKSDVVKIGDFGIATALDAGQKQANSVVGTPYYMAPELLNQQPYTDAVDMFALGCT